MLNKISEIELGRTIPIVAIVIAFIFSLVVMPMAYSKPKDIKIGIINQDEGMKIANKSVNVGNQTLEKIVDSSKENEDSPIKWIELTNENKISKGFENNDYVAVLVIPKDFSMKQMSLQTLKPQSPELKLTINQGYNSTVSSLVEKALDGMINQLNSTIQPSILMGINKSGSINENQAKVYLEPIKLDKEYINKIGNNMANGSAHAVLFIIIWITTMIASALVYIYISKTSGASSKEVNKKKIYRLLYIILISMIIAGTITFIGNSILSLDIPLFETFSFLMIAVLCIMLLIVGILNFTGIGGIVLFVIIMFLGMTSVNLPYEFLPSFWQDWIYPWIPIRFIADGLKDIFYLGFDIFNSNTMILIGIGITGLIIYLLSLLKKTKATNEV